MIIRPAIVCLLFCSICHADDIYLKTGFVLRNVQVIDTTNGRINGSAEGKPITIDTALVLRIDRLDMLSGEKSTYEMFSQELRDEYQKHKEELEAPLLAAKADSLQRLQEHLDSTYTWRRSAYVACGWGIPQGYRFELGYNHGESVALAVSFGIGDNWSRDPHGGTFAILALLRFPIPSLPITPFLLLSRGGTIAIFGNADSYTLIYMGAMVELRPGIHLRSEFGLALTSKHVSGGSSLFGETYPEVKEDRTRLGVNVTLEIDFAHLY